MTVVQWPFQLQANAFSSAPSGLTASSITAENQNCPYGDNCLQVFTFDITPTSACTLTGDYVVNFVVVCMEPGQCSNSTSTVTLSLQSTDFCVSLQSSVSASSSIDTYSDSGHHVEKHSFSINQTGYFLITTSSESPLSLTEIKGVVLGTSETLYAPDLSIDVGVVGQVENNANDASFSLLFAPNVFSVAPQKTQVYTITVTVEVTFADNTKKRSSISSQYRSLTSSVVHIQGLTTTSDDEDMGSSSASNMLCCRIFALVLSLIYILLI